MTNADVDVTLAGAMYDRTLALIDGRVQPQGVKLRYLAMPVEEVFWRALRHQEFDAAELSLAYYIVLRSRGDRTWTAIPVFPSRFFRHGCIFVPRASPLQSLEELRGTTIGLPEYAMTACVWLRGILWDEFRIAPSEISWRVGGIETAGRRDRIELPSPPGVDLQKIEEGQTLSGLLSEGAIDAVISPRVPSACRAGDARRLLPHYQRAEAEYYERTGVFPMMHVIVLRSSQYDLQPWVASSLFEAFQRAKHLAYEWLADINALPVSLPWYVPEFERTRAVFGEDPWVDGFEQNRDALETLVRYLVEQGLARETGVEELFAPNTLDRYVI